MKFRVPSADDEILLHPSRDGARQLVQSNHTLLEGLDLEVAGESFLKLRHALRRRLAHGTGVRLAKDLRIIVGAHQPGFPGPGILYKHTILEGLAPGHLSVNLVIDSDVSQRISVGTPHLRGQSIGLKDILIFPNPSGLCFEALYGPPREFVDERYEQIEDLLHSLKAREVVESFRRFRSIHDRVYMEGETAATILTEYRRRYYPTPHVHETLISTLTSSEEFGAYACDIIERTEEFTDAYNQSLHLHRRRYRIRSRANPFPDLVQEDKLRELPFWGIDRGGMRHRLYAGGTAGNRFVVAESDSDRVAVNGAASLSCLRLRPRAVCLTMFLRMFVADLFVHGVGGGNYDRVTDRIIEDYYGVSPPGYVVCSRTKFLLGDTLTGLETKASHLRQKLRRMRNSPESFAPVGDAVAAEVRHILSGLTGKPSASEHATLSDLRGILLERIAPQITTAESELADIGESLRRQATFHRRDLPYFLYARNQL
jgi:hypothetical protein